MGGTTPRFRDPAAGARFLAAYEELLARWPVPVAAMDVPTSYGTTRVHSSGPADGTPVVLLPGGGETSLVWGADAAALSGRYRVHAVDPLGQAGLSIPAGLPVRSADDLAGWLDEVLDGLGVAGPVVLGGHSYGGWMAAAYALAAPAGRVGALLLVDPTGCFGGFSLRYLLHAAPFLLRPGADRWRRFLAWETRGAALDEAWLEVSAQGAAAFGRVSAVRTRPVDRLELPALVVLGGRSRAHDPARIAAAVADRAPRAEVHVLPGAGHHTLPLNHAAELDPLIMDFLDRTTGAAGDREEPGAAGGRAAPVGP